MTDKHFAISELLRGADKEIKAGRLAEALNFINRVFELDTRNIYAKAYKERILSLMEAQGITRADAHQMAAHVSPAAPEPAAPTVKNAPAKSEAKGTKSEAKPAEAPSPAAPADPPSPPSAGKTGGTIRRSAAAAEAYRTLLLEIWKDGSITPEEQQRVDSMRDTFAITVEEHAEIEQSVRATAYLHAVRDAWKKGTTNFQPVRQRFGLTDQERTALEPKVLQLLQSLQSKGSVLVMDDDKAFLTVITEILTEAGYYCFTAVSGEEALNLLDTMTPDIVICDINFQKPNMSGFAFYEKFRSIDKFLTTPFIFLSALDQEVLVRTGKKLGADDYLTKPVDAEMLTATLEGKLRRSRELRRSAE